MDLDLVNGLVDRMRLGGCVEVGSALTAEIIEAHVGVRAVRNGPDADDLAADHDVISNAKPGARIEADF